MIRKSVFLFIMSILWIYPLFTATQDSMEIEISIDDPGRDLPALQALYDSTGGPHWQCDCRGGIWDIDRPLETWCGVTLDEQNRVVALKIDNWNLNGQLPAELGDLSELRTLLISSNKNLTGTVPPELAKLQKLEFLCLSGNRLTGSIPPELGYLKVLKVLRLDNNLFGGEVPEEIFLLENLEKLRLHGNRLSGTITNRFGCLPNLKELILFPNDFSRGIPPELKRFKSIADYINNQEVPQLTEPDSGLGTRFKKGSKLRVFAVSGLNLRGKPDIRARTLKVVTYGEEVEVLHTLNGDAELQVDWIKGHWLYVRTREREGFVFDGYLSDLPVPRIGDENLQCRSREAFATLLKNYVIHYMESVGETVNRVVIADPGKSFHEQTILKLAGGHGFVFNQYFENASAELTLIGIRFTDAYNLVTALIHSCPNRQAVMDDLVFIRNRQGDIDRIKGRFENFINIRKIGTDDVKVTMISTL